MLSPRSVSPSLFPCCQRDEWVWYGCVLGCVYESKAEGQAYVVPHQHCPEKRGWPNIWQDPVLHYLERCSFKGGERGVVRRPAIACGHLPLFPKPSPNNSHQDSRHNWKSTNHYNVSQVFWHSANIQAAWLQDSFPSCELISSTQTSKWGRRIPCNASVISYRKTALNIFFIKVFAHETVYVLRGECVRSLDSAGAYGGFPWFLSIMFPSPDFSEQKMEERMRENPIYLYSWTWL